jgi:hypothetical protein
MKKLTLALILLFPFVLKAQDVQLDEKDGISISYKLSKISTDSKKDTYLLVCKATNTKDYDLFYQVPPTHPNPFFAVITVRSIDRYLYITGTESKLSGKDGKLYYIKKGGFISQEKEFKFAAGSTPIITSEFNGNFREITDFR